MTCATLFCNSRRYWLLRQPGIGDGHKDCPQVSLQNGPLQRVGDQFPGVVFQEVVEKLDCLPVRLALSQELRPSYEVRFQSFRRVKFSIGQRPSVKLSVEAIPRVLQIGIKQPLLRLANVQQNQQRQSTRPFHCSVLSRQTLISGRDGRMVN